MNEKYLKIFSLLTCLIVCLIPTKAWSQETADEVDDVTKSELFGYMDMSGSLYSTFQFRSFDSRDDSDLYQFLSLELDDIYKDTIDGAFSMMWHENLNGANALKAGENYDPFIDLDLTNDSNRFRFFTGYVDIKKVFFEDSSLRLGRQYLEEIDHAHFDGATYRFSPIESLDVTLFGGRPITYYSPTSGDSLYGTNLQYQFSHTTKAAMRYYRYDTDEYIDDLGAVELWHMFSPSVQSHFEFSLLDGEPYILQSDLYAQWDEMDFDVVAQLIRLFDDVGDHTINFDPYFPLLNNYEPFTYGALNATKGLGDYFSLVGGFDIRQSDDINDPVTGFTNRDYWRITAGAEVYPTKQLTISVNGEYWDVDDDDQFTGITGEIEYRPNKKWTLTAGVDYGEYVQHYRDEFLYLFGQDETFRITPDAITYYARVRWKPTSKLYTGMTFEVEDNDWDEDEWYSLRLEIGSHF